MIKKLSCMRCFHRWVQRKEIVLICPKCKTKYWKTLKKEVWKDVDKNYKISNFGRVYSVRNDLILKGRSYSCEYLHVRLYDKEVMIHILVLEAFVCKCPKGYEGNHDDGIKHNNKLSNLEWMTKSDNQKHALRTGLRPVCCNKNFKFHDGEIWLVKKLFDAKINRKKIMKIFKMSESHLYEIGRRKRRAIIY